MSSRNPLVSVIIPNYNHAAFLDKRLSSIFKQTFNDYEVILLDDASTDSSQKIIKKFKKFKKFKSIINNENSGNTFKQWNLGVNNANGEYVWIAESDDFADPKLLNRLVTVLNNNQNVGISYCQSYFVNENDEIIGSHLDNLSKFDTALLKKQFVISGKDLLKNFMISINVIPNASAVLFRKKVYERIGGAVENMQLCGDWMTWSKISLNTDVAFIAEPLNYYRIHNSTVRNTVQIKPQYLFEYMQVIKFISENVSISSKAKKRSLHQIKKRWVRICLNQSYEIYSRDFPKIFNDVKILFGNRTACLFIFFGMFLPLLKPIMNYRNNK